MHSSSLQLLLRAAIFLPMVLSAPLDCSNTTAAATSALLTSLKISELLQFRFEDIVAGLSVIVQDESPDGGGGTNPDGVYFGPLSDARSLPTGACDHMSGLALAECYPANDPDLPDVEAVTFSSIMAVNDAQVWFGCTPPNAAYFGFDTIITTRTFPRSPPPAGDDNQTFTEWFPGINFADPVNNVNTGIGSNAPSEPMVVIFTADASTADALSAAYTKHADVPSTSIHVVKLDSKIFAPLVGDRSAFDDWKHSKPDNLRHLIRFSIPYDEEEYTKYKTTAFPFFSFNGHTTGDAEPYEPTSVAREIDADESSEVETEWMELSEQLLKEHSGDGFTLLNMVTVNNELAGLYDDWEAVLADPATTIASGSFPAGTRDGTYGFGIITTPVTTKPARLVVVGADHTRTGLKASYAQMGVNMFAPGNPIVPNPGSDAMPYSRWFDHRDLESIGDGGEMWYKEFVFNGAECSESALKKEGCCVDEASGLDTLVGATIMVGTRTYALEATGVGPSKDELFEARVFMFEQ
jgi:hypothetical protein